MIKEEKILLEEDLVLEYQSPEAFHKLYAVYQSYKNGETYFHHSKTSLMDRLEWLNACYTIRKNGQLIGGVILKANYMTDLFLVPPYEDYGLLLSRLVEYVKGISDPKGSITFNFVLDEHLKAFEALGFERTNSDVYMIRPTEVMQRTLMEGYECLHLKEEDKASMAQAIRTAYLENPCYSEVASIEEYMGHVDFVLSHTADKPVLYDASKVIKEKSTGEVVATCFHMEDGGLPFIMSFVVRPEHQGKGLGGFLLRESLSVLDREYPAVRLSVIAENNAVKIYEKYGFIKGKITHEMELAL